MTDLARARRFAWALGVVAAAAVVGTSAAAVVVDDDEPTLALTSAGSSLRVPSEGWRIMGADDAVAYTDGRGTALVAVRGPAVYAAGWCDDFSHAFVGFVDRRGRSVAALARAWGRAITLDTATGEHSDAVRPVVRSGRADADLVVPPDSCNPPRVHLTVLRSGPQAVVMVRDVGVDGALTASDAEEILASVDPVG